MVDRFTRSAAARQRPWVFDPSARPRRPLAARLCDERWPLAAAGDGRRRRSALLRLIVRLRRQALPRTPRRRSAGAHARGVPADHQRPHPLRRLDADHAGGAPVGAAQRPLFCGKNPPDRARRRDRARALQGPGALALSRTRALRRQYRRHPRRLARLFRQGAAPAHARPGGAARRLAAIAGAAPAGSLPGGRAHSQRSRARPLRCGRNRAGRRNRARQGRTGADRAAADAHVGAARSRPGDRGRPGSEGDSARPSPPTCRRICRSWRANASARWRRRSAPVSRLPSSSSTTPRARFWPMSARPLISTNAAPAKWI